MPFSCLKVILYLVYLSQLLGWQAILAGSAVAALAMVVSNRLSVSFREMQAQENKARGNTSNTISEAITSLRHIRLSSMEPFWKRRLNEARTQELNVAWKTKMQEETVAIVASLGPMLLASVALSYSALASGNLSSAVAFTALNLFGDLHKVVKGISSQYAAIHRWRLGLLNVKQYLEQAERIDAFEISDTIQLEDASLDWTGSASETHLRNVDITIAPGTLTLVTGVVGGGKSLLLSSIIGEAIVQSGKLCKPAISDPSTQESWIIPGSMAYVSQPPWIEDSTIRHNITFGCSFDEKRYHSVLTACALLPDLAGLPKGDQTVAGQGGSSLSGGQKWRVALARALYSSAEILVLEDVIAAVDAPIARHICDKALQGELVYKRTVIMATHRPDYCATFADYIATAKNGTVSIVQQQVTKSKWTDIEEPDAPKHTDPKGTTSPAPESVLAPDYWKVLYAYIDLGGSAYSFLFSILITICYRILAGSTSWWLAKWTSRPAIDSNRDTQWHDATVYIALTVASTVLVSLQALLFTRIGHDSSTVLFNRLTERLLKAKLSWIDTIPAGQVIQTLNSDMYAINHRMAPQIIGIASSMVQIILVCFTR